MLHRHDQLELLAFIEGEMDAAQAAIIRARLSKEPAVLAAVEQMAADRVLMREMPDPYMPRDFLAELEPVLARSMLIESDAGATTAPSTPGEFRRQYRRQTRRIRWGRLAAAAVVFMALIAGVWAAVNQFIPRPSNQDMRAANGTPAHSADVVAAIETGVLHHHMPVKRADSSHLAATTTPVASQNAAPIPAQFAIVLEAGIGGTELETQLAEVLSSAMPQAAFVRNFSYEEGQRLWREAMALDRGREARETPMASVGTSKHRVHEIATMLRERPQAHRSSERAVVSASGAIIGSDDQGPTLEQQLEFSQRGATHAVSVPVRTLHSLLEKLAASDTTEVRARLQMLPAIGTNTETSASGDLMNWLAELANVRAEVQRLSELPANTIVHVPVIVHPK